MAGYSLPENVTGGSTGHITHTNSVHDIVNKFDKDASPTDGQVLTWDSGTSLYVPETPGAAVSGIAWLDSFAGANDAAKLTAAMTYAAAQTQPPTIVLAPRDHDFSGTNGRNLYSGFAMSGPSDAGLQTVEQNTDGAKARALFNGGSGTSSLFYANTGGDIYNPITMSNIAWRSTNNVSQFLHAPISTTNLYGATFGNLEFTGWLYCIGQPNDAATITLSTFWGAWNIPNMAGTPISVRGSDNWLVPDECNIGWNAGPTGEYLIRLENVQKTIMRGFYLTCREGGTRAILVDNQSGSGFTQGGLFISDCVIEGQNSSEPAGGALIYINDHGVVDLSNIALNFAMGSPTQFTPDDTGYIMCDLASAGLVSVHDITVTRATGISQDVPIVIQSGGGRVNVERIWGMPGNSAGQAWTNLPVVTSSAGVMRTDATVRVV